MIAFAYLMDQGEAAWTQPYYSSYLNRYIISYRRPIYKDGVMVAIVGIDIDFQAFIDRLYANPPEGEHGMVILSDTTGTVEYAPDKPLGIQLADKDIHIRDVADKVAEAGQTDNMMVTYDWAGQESIAGIKGLRNGMNFIDLRRKPQIYNRTHKAVMQMVLGLVAVCILASLLPIYMINRLSERLKRVIEAAKEVGEGNYDIKLHDTQRDDIGELSRNFQAMVGKVAASTRRSRTGSRRTLIRMARSSASISTASSSSMTCTATWRATRPCALWPGTSSRALGTSRSSAATAAMSSSSS